MPSKRIAGRCLCTTMLSGVAAAAVAPITSAVAQEGAVADDNIVVTGTRIQRADLESPSPITSITSEQLVLTNTVNTEQFLNTLPQVIPAFDSTSNNPGDGTATVDLRGLGVERTLVLVDGTRFVGSAATGVVDLNNIPAALVERVDVVTGGASALYGSDAVAGVVNFILKDDFEGVQLDISNELSAAEWDGNIFQAALTAGGNFADGRGNAVVSLSYTNREALFQGEREFSRDTLRDNGTDEFLLAGSGSVLGGQFISLANTSVSGDDPGFLNPDGTPFYPCTPPGGGQTCTNNVTFNGAPEGRRLIAPQDEYNYAPVNYLQIPQERYSIYAGASYEINDHMEFYGRGLFASTVVDAQLAPTPAGGALILNLDNPNIPDDFLQALIATYDFVGVDDEGNNISDVQDRDGDGEVDDILLSFGRRMTETGARNDLRDTNSFQIMGGLRGDINENWSYDIFAQFGRTSISRIQTGNLSFSALQEGVLDGSVNLFGVDSISPEAADAISRTGAVITNIEQIQMVAAVNGLVEGVQSPFANSPLGVAFGVEYREEFSDVIPDSVLGPDVRGFNATLPVSGRYDVYELFGEVQMPIVQDAPFAYEVSLNGAYRYSDYSIANVGGTHTFAVGGDWAPIEGYRFRAQFQRAVRAPNVAELFQPFSNGFPGAADPCSSGNGLFDELTDGNAANGEVAEATLRANCTANGVPEAQVGQAFQLSAQIESLFGGNPNLSEETADTLTIGLVAQPSFLEGLTLQIDYYDISIEDAIEFIPLQAILDGCYQQGDPFSCSFFDGSRDPGGLGGLGARDPLTGEIGAPYFSLQPEFNTGALEARGIDFQIQYAFDADQIGLPATAGSFTMQYYGNYTLKNDFQASPNLDPIECAGQFGATCGEPIPEYSHTSQFNWLYGPLTTSLRWRYIGSVEEDGTGGVGDLSDSNGSRNYVDVTLAYNVNDNLDLTLGVQNINDADVPLLGDQVSEQANTFPATYETLGRQGFIGASLRF